MLTEILNTSKELKPCFRHPWLKVTNSTLLKIVNVSMQRTLFLGHLVRDYILETKNRKTALMDFPNMRNWSFV